ncbi:peptidoglycan/LPS O-acetylase OafA/YrhL [Leucobacter exalbidus]|uniref:Peptidoglycan/LPS O-acetylase OafA/YrhL n=1 Tax=Leucobacter exalbidus TaxID=662960 RepID=A0A940T3S9_9MICO|nr:acyltransferase family protein [Leucobacter exalbidus]MBP1326099.1 peptidoglycan/LPS O-acetylase OafA/YrhL [Leucobacter exalbidus]
MTEVSYKASRKTASSTGIPAYLSGVQGLRTAAALLVAVYHIWFNRVSGGVDVFFVVAGYFATKSLIKMQLVDTFGARFKFVAGYWMRTLRRIMPSAVVVIIGTVIASILFMPQSLWQFAIPHGFAALFQFENWQLIATGADYLQQEMNPSPFQQFWALSLQAQIYLTLPLIMLAAATIASRFRLGMKQTTMTVILIVLFASFAFSVWYTVIDQPAAYFNTFARYWEFVGGSVLFFVMTRGLKNRVVAQTLGWLGLAMLIGLGATVDVSMQFPGWVALIPISAAVLIMISAASDASPVILRKGPLPWFGDASFAFYLWHWPILVIFKMVFKPEQVGVLGGLGVLLLSAALAYVTTRFIEAPLRNWKRIQSTVIATLVAIVLIIVPAYAALGTWQGKLTSNQHAAQEALEHAIANEELNDNDALVPDPSVARDDIVDVYPNGCHQNQKSAEVIVCESGDPDGSLTIAVVGGSHSAQWIDTVRAAADEVDAKVETLTKSACVFGNLDKTPVDANATCKDWNIEALGYLLENKPDLVVTMATRQLEAHDETFEGYWEYFQALDAAGIPVLGIRDNPRFTYDVAECVELKGAEACEQPIEVFYDTDQQFDFSMLKLFTFVDIVPVICPDGTCRVVQGNVLMYRDGHHFTRTWTLRYGDIVEEAITDIFDQDSDED